MRRPRTYKEQKLIKEALALKEKPQRSTADILGIPKNIHLTSEQNTLFDEKREFARRVGNIFIATHFGGHKNIGRIGLDRIEVEQIAEIGLMKAIFLTKGKTIRNPDGYFTRIIQNSLADWIKYHGWSVLKTPPSKRKETQTAQLKEIHNLGQEQRFNAKKYLEFEIKAKEAIKNTFTKKGANRALDIFKLYLDGHTRAEISRITHIPKSNIVYFMDKIISTVLLDNKLREMLFEMGIKPKKM